MLKNQDLIRKQYIKLKVINKNHKSLTNEMDLFGSTHQAFSVYQDTNS